MISQEEINKWLNGLAVFDTQNERYILAMYALLGLPKNYIDIGSGTGAMVNISRKLGIEAFGVDRLPRVESYLIQHDLTEKFFIDRQFDLVTCIEVVEHIEEQFENIIVNTIVRHVRMGGILVTSIAPPGQEGDGHVNLKGALYWRARFDACGLSFSEILTLRLMNLWNGIYGCMQHLPCNVQIFSRGTIQWGTFAGI